MRLANLLPNLHPIAKALAGAIDEIRVRVATRRMAAYQANETHLVAILSLIFDRLHRLVLRINRLAQQHETGTLPKPQKPRTTPRKPPATPPLRLPEGRGWLARLAPGSGGSGAFLLHLLTTEEFQTLLAAAPQTARLLRPLLHALAWDPPATMQLPPRPRKPRKPKPKRPKPKGAYPRFNIKTYSPGQAFLRDLKRKKPQ